MKRFLMFAVFVAALAAVGTSAEAGWRSYGLHGRFISRQGSYGYRGRCYPRTHRAWHNTSHYDWHPGQYYRHGNHLHYQRGHYDFHRTGHWDTHSHH